jgi:hypothetical protein
MSSDVQDSFSDETPGPTAYFWHMLGSDFARVVFPASTISHDETLGITAASEREGIFSSKLLLL